jgi:hypothetical protein
LAASAADTTERFDTANWSLFVIYAGGEDPSAAIVQTPPPLQRRPSILLSCIAVGKTRVDQVLVHASIHPRPSARTPITVDFGDGHPVRFLGSAGAGGDVAVSGDTIWDDVLSRLGAAKRVRVTVGPDSASFDVSGFAEVGDRFRQICGAIPF